MGYLHGYTDLEQNRLLEQAQFLENKIFEHLDLSDCRNLLEVGCGTGAECEILLRRYPHLHVTGIDISPTQVEKARCYLSERKELASRWKIELADARQLSAQYKDQFDGVFFCWVLEHLADPVQILSETRKTMRAGGRIHITEVYNRSLHIEPSHPVLERYWESYNRLQLELGGDPHVGVKLGRILKDAGYDQIRLRPGHFLFDSRDCAARGAMLSYWLNLLLSGKDQLIQARWTSEDEVEALCEFMRAAQKKEETIFYYSFMQGEAAKNS